jgi:chaperonin GroES
VEAYNDLETGCCCGPEVDEMMRQRKGKERRMNLTPMNDWILVRRDEAQQVSEGGIQIPQTALTKPKEGVVLAVGPGKRLPGGGRAPVQVKVDERIVFASYAGTEIVVDGEELLLMAEGQVMAVKGDEDAQGLREAP